jgi:hypothetical protein
MLERIRLHAGAVMDHQDGGTPAGDLVVVGEIAFQLHVAVAVLDPLGLHLGLRRDGDGRKRNGRRKHAEHGHGCPPRLSFSESFARWRGGV